MLLNEKICGLGDPENLLWLPNKHQVLDRCVASKVNALYCHASSFSDFDGNPFIDGDPSKPLDPHRMGDWQAFIQKASSGGVWTFLFLHDDDSDPFNSGAKVTPAELQYIQQLVYYFGDIERLVWVVGEEYREAIHRNRASQIAALLKQYDQGRHTVGIHQNSGLQFDFGDDPNIDLFMIQWIGPDRHAIYHGLTNAIAEARGRYELILSESTHPDMDWYGSGAIMRKKNWAVFMTGCRGVMVYTRGTTRFGHLSDTDFRQIGFQATVSKLIPRINEFVAMPWTARQATEYVLKDPDEDRWILYTSRPGPLGAGEFSPKDYKLSWFDPVSCGGLNENRFICGMVELNRMSGIGQEAAVYIRPA